jgi:signal transduction histidine kinase
MTSFIFDNDNDIITTGNEKIMLSPYNQVKNDVETGDAWKVLVVDDEANVHQVTRLALDDFVFQGKGVKLLSAYSGRQVKQILQEHPDIALILLDVVMENDEAGLEAVKDIREMLGNRLVRIILLTGQPGKAPEETVVLEYGINGYKTKTELTRQKLCTTVVTALRTYCNLKMIEENRQELATLSTQLEMRNAELTIAMEKAEAANRAKSRFIANISHELRTPMTSILGFSRMIKQKLDDKIIPFILMDSRANEHGITQAVQQVHEDVSIVIVEAETLTNSIDDIINMTELEDNEIKWQMYSLNVSDLIASAVATASTLFAEKRLLLLKEIEPDLPQVIGDHDRLTQVIFHLLTNAAKFTNKGQVICRAKHEGDEIVVSVSDTGIGIAEVDLPRIFDKFEQLGNTLTGKPRGIGLGLPLCKRIITHHGGRIWAESELNQGSTFSFALPIDK